MAKKHTVFLLLGSNISPRTVYLQKAIRLLGNLPGDITVVSSLYESEPWGFEAPVAFLNQVVCLKTTLEPLEILHKTQEIERQLGRAEKTKGRYVSRKIDIDLLFFDDEIVEHPVLIIPHAQIANRRFTLMPLVEVAPEKIHPVLQKTCHELLEECRDEGKVWKIKEEQVYAL